jgi:16S rRNA processing protein RimM
VKAIVPEVHLGEGWVGITPPPGLLELGMAQDKDGAAPD